MLVFYVNTLSDETYYLQNNYPVITGNSHEL